MTAKRIRSPGYPSAALPEAIDYIRKLHSQNRTNPIDREAAAKDIGYSGLTGRSAKILATLSHYGLLQKAGKGGVQVTQRAVNILHPDPSNPGQRAEALLEAAFEPDLFMDLKLAFPDGPPSENAVKSYLNREGFAEAAIPPASNSYLETYRFLQQEGAFKSHGDADQHEAESNVSAGDSSSGITFGGAKVGDFIQWESGGMLQFKQPRRVRWISDDGQYVAVEGEKTSLPMSQVIVEAAPIKDAPTPPPEEPSSPLMTDTETKVTDFKVSKHGDKLVISGTTIGTTGVKALMAELELYEKMIALSEGKSSTN